jgi:hypothetical protein
MLRRFIFSVGLLGLCMALQPRPAQAIAVSAVECSVVAFPCPIANIIDSGIRSNGVGLLGANRFTVLPFAFGNASVTFSGTLLATDILGSNVYIWGGGAATYIGGAGNFYLDVQISQNYVTAGGIGQFSEFNIGNCTANTVGTASGVAATLGVNGSFLPVLGSAGPIFGGDCLAAGGPGGTPGFTQNAGPAAIGIGGVTNLTALAQFYFDAAGGLNQSINLPWGEDFPDIIDFPGLIPTPTTIGSFGVSDQSPEPATLSMLGGALCLMAFRLRGRKR